MRKVDSDATKRILEAHLRSEQELLDDLEVKKSFLLSSLWELDAAIENQTELFEKLKANSDGNNKRKH